MTSLAWLVPGLPAGAALAGLLTARRLPRTAAPLAIVATAAATVSAAVVLARSLPDPARVFEATALLTPTGGLAVALGTRVDGLAAVVAVMVCVVALLVQVYSTAYLRGDPRYPSYAGFVSLFTAAMLLVVLAADLIEMLVGWEVMGLCSYLLIGHYREEPAAGRAATKAFLMTRVGDVGFLFGLFTLGAAAGSFRISDILARVGELDSGAVTVATLLLVCGVAGKSAQFPLHTWLPDAMAGPTPISALIHAATMVAAGVYVVARLYPVFLRSPATLDVLGVVAVLTMLLGALVALVQDDLKRVLAWSTVSQLAYMTAALAVGGWTAGIYHLLSHAAFKALLFLAAGSVLSAVGTNLMSEMGGLWRRMPLTFATTVVGAAALVGLPPLSGAFSKDAVLAAARDAALGSAGTAPVTHLVAVTVYAAQLVTVVITALYATRLVVRVFFGSYRGRATVHESSAVMTGPLVVLVLAVVALGLPALSPSYGVSRWLDGLPGAAPVRTHLADLGLGTGLALVGIGVVLLAHRLRPGEDPALRLGRLAEPLRRAFYVDEFYRVTVVTPVGGALTRASSWIDRVAIGGVVDGSGRSARALGGGLRLLQNGNVQAYATAMFVGVVVLAVTAAIR